MSNRLATRIGLPSAEERPPDAFDLAAFHEPSVGALARTKGSLFLLAQLTGGSASLAKAAQEAIDAIQRDYYYDLSAGVVVSLAKALAGANRRLYHARKRLGIPRRSGVSVVAVVIRGHEAHAAKLGPASAVIVRDGRMYEVPPPPAVTEEDPRIRRRRVAATLGEALEVEPYTWQGALAPGDRIALVSRHFAHTVGVEELKGAIGSMRPAQAVEHLQHLFAIRGGPAPTGSLPSRSPSCLPPRPPITSSRSVPPSRSPACRTRAQSRWQMRSAAACIEPATRPRERRARSVAAS